MFFGIAQAAGQIGGHIGQQHVVGDVGDQHHANANQQGFAVLGEDLAKGNRRTLRQGGAVLFFHLFQLLGKGRGLFSGMAQVQAQNTEGAGNQEGNAPAPILEGFFGQGGLQQHDQTGAQNKARNGAKVQPAAQESALPVGGVLSHKDRRAGVFTAYGKTLGQLAQQQQDGSPDADG